MRPTTLTAPSWYTASICSRGGVECAEFEAGSRDWQPPLVLARAWGCLLWTQMPSDICVQTRLAACQRLSLQRDSLDRDDHGRDQQGCVTENSESSSGAIIIEGCMRMVERASARLHQ